MNKVILISMIILSISSFNIYAQEKTLTVSTLQGLWSSNCNYIPNSHPTEPGTGTYQKAYFRIDSVAWNHIIKIYNNSDPSCSSIKLFETTANYKYKIEGDATLSNGTKVTKISATLSKKNEFFDKYIKEILLFENNKLYLGIEEEDDDDDDTAKYPLQINHNFYFSKE